MRASIQKPQRRSTTGKKEEKDSVNERETFWHDATRLLGSVLPETKAETRQLKEPLGTENRIWTLGDLPGGGVPYEWPLCHCSPEDTPGCGPAESLGSVTCPGGGGSTGGAAGAQTDRGRTRAAAGQAHTHVSFAEGHVYYAADYDEGIKGVPGVTKIALDRAGGGTCR